MAARSSIISNARMLTRVTKGRGTFLAAGAEDPWHLRSPQDVPTLGRMLMGAWGARPKRSLSLKKKSASSRPELGAAVSIGGRRGEAQWLVVKEVMERAATRNCTDGCSGMLIVKNDDSINCPTATGSYDMTQDFIRL